MRGAPEGHLATLRVADQAPGGAYHVDGLAPERNGAAEERGVTSRGVAAVFARAYW